MSRLAVGLIAGLCALALGGLALAVLWAARRGARHVPLCALSLAVATVALLAAVLALALGAGQSETGHFLIGMSAGVAVGLPLGCALILISDQRAA